MESASLPPSRLRWGLGLISAATLAFEITLTRLFSVAQFYHFAFMIVSIALLGFGASGTALAIFPALGRKDSQKSLARLALATGLSLLGAYLLTNLLPFDSFSIAWDRRQVAILILDYLALATPSSSAAWRLDYCWRSFRFLPGRPMPPTCSARRWAA